MAWAFKKGALLLICGALLFTGSAMLFQQARVALFNSGESEQTKPAPLNVTLLHGQISDLQGAFSVDSVDNYTIGRGGKDAFSLLLAHYKDDQNQQRRAVLFPKGKQEARSLPSPTELRQVIWQDAAKAISENTPKDALILSWWDDGQRIHF